MNNYLSYPFTDNASENEEVLPWESEWSTYRSLPYATLCQWADALGVVLPNPETVAQAVKDGALGFLTVTEDMQFVSWE